MYNITNLYREVFGKLSPLREKDIDHNAQEILKMRYYMDLPDGDKEKEYSQLCRRVAKVVVASEFKEDMTAEDLKHLVNIETNIYNDMMSHRFLFNSPALFSAGVGISTDPKLSELLYKDLRNSTIDEIKETYRKIKSNYSKNQMMFACFTIDVPDSIEGIFDSVKNAAIISKFGGGVGANFGNLREKGALIAGGLGGKASGPISFMQNWNTMGSTVVQGGKRRAALMGMLYSHHPDIEDFITAKSDNKSLTYFNISVAIDDKFMEAVKNNDEYELISPADGRVVRKVKARKIWDKICENAHRNGDPGIFFIDTANKDNILKMDEKYYIESTNPCLTGDTLVMTTEGEKRIDEITTDDYVITFNIETKEFETEKVEFYGCTRKNANIIKIELEDGKVLKLTPDHKVYTENRGYVEASNLTKNDTLIIIEDNGLTYNFTGLKDISKAENEDVYDITVKKNHNFFANRILVHNCGEQPLPNNSSCNLGSINLYEFVDDSGEFNYEAFKEQVLRSVYYLDLVIDATSYPLEIIERNTKDIRPIGLGIMGLADACIKMGIKYGSEEFEDFADKIAKIMATYSLIGTVSMAKLKGPYPHFDAPKGERAFLTQFVKDTEISIDNIDEIIKRIQENDEIPISFRNAIVHYKESYMGIDKEYMVGLLKSIFSTTPNKDGLRNSRRLSIAPTGTISLILNTSSGIEPNFHYRWTRQVTVEDNKKQTLMYYHRLYNKENEEKGLLIKAHDVTPEQHVKVVAIFAPYVDSAISKTVNLPSDATVEDVKKVYEKCYEYKIKGITIYRDGSKDQPIKGDIEEDKKEEKKEVIKDNYGNKVNKIRIRPRFMKGVTTKSDSPYGSIYVTANFDDDGNMFETFISSGKSGSVSKSITEALSRVISLALRSGVDIEDLINTISNISGSEVWVYNLLDGEEVVVKSIPDAVAKMLKDLNTYYKMTFKHRGCETIIDATSVKEQISSDDNKFGHYRNWCPECGVQMMQTSGCSVCPSCGFSDCK